MSPSEASRGPSAQAKSEDAGDSQSQSLADLLVTRLEESTLDDEARLLVLAAAEGDGELADALEGAVEPGRRAEASPALYVEPASAYLSAVTVQGFRGIGPQASLSLQPSAGLTLVVGRNGSGKSSFAEGVEAALTGTSYRWADRTAVWRTGLRNLHGDDPTTVTVEMLVDGDRGRTVVSRSWAGTDVDDSQVWAQRPGQQRAALASLGWERHLATYRPFLSYAELGGMLEGKPSEMYDAIASILGLERLAAAEKRLVEARRTLDREAKDLKDALGPLLEELAASDDPRAREVEKALKRRPWDLDRAEELATSGTHDERDGELSMLRRLSQLAGPREDFVAGAVQALRPAADTVAGLRDTDADEAGRLADLLERALDHRDQHADDRTCPVCGTADVLDDDWAATTRTEVERLRRSAAEVEAAYAETRRAVRDARALITPPPHWLPEGPAAEAWRAWYAGAALDDASALADHLAGSAARLREAVEEARTAARQRLDELEDRWRPIALKLGSWVAEARDVEANSHLRTSVKAGYDWLRTEVLELRNERLRPLAEQSAGVWAELRQESNVELGPIQLAGSGNQRKVSLDVTVDGVDGAALGVMSQGELHALALALFLPRATVPESPFRFLVIDDPVQSMDPAKVDGLARVLSRTAERRQVVVLTHDARLADAVRRLRLPARVLEVVRRERSVVEVRKLSDPVARLLDDARALVNTRELPPDVARRVVPGLCREALEAALVERARRERLASGTRHADVDDAIAVANGPYELGALAFFGDTRRSGDVLSLINRYGGWAGDTFLACRGGGHGAYAGQLAALVRDTERLTERIRDEH